MTLPNIGETMAKKCLSFVFCFGIAISLGTAAFAQSSRVTSAAGDKYVISARAGGVNYTEGTVTVARNSGRSGQLVKGDELEIGDRVATAENGRMEVLLNPGSYMRVGANTNFELKTTSLDDLKIRIESGTAMFEVFADNEFRVSIVSPKGSIALIESGIYRVVVDRSGGARISVWDGRAELGDAAKTEVKRGRVGTILSNNATVEKFDRDDNDELVAWSKTRGKQLAKASASLKDRAIRGLLINSFNGGRWGMYNSFGLWIVDTAFGGSCFLPFGRGWYSPYGYGYGSGIGWYNLPPVIYYPPTVTNAPNIYGTKTRARGIESEPSSNSAMSRDRGARPPFLQMENNSNNGARDNSPIRSIPDYNTDRQPSSGPVYSAPPVVIYNAPANTGSRPR